MIERGKTESDLHDLVALQKAAALEERAFEAWRAFGPDGESPPEEDATGDDFVDRVMEALEASHPRLVLIDPSIPMDVRRWWQRPIGRVAALATAAALVAGISVPLLLDAGKEEAAVSVTGDAHPGETTGDGSEPTSGEDDEPSATLPEDLDRRVQAYVNGYGINYGPAFKFHGVIIVARKGEIRYSRAFGVADRRTGDPNTADTRFRLGLLTEPFTAVAILQLEQAGALDTDDAIARYLPDFPRGDQITIRDLLTHRSGIPNYTDDPSFHFWKAQPHATRDMIDRFRDWPLEFSPGSESLPSNSNYYLLGAIIEKVSGNTYGEYIEQHVFTPAGMQASGFGDAWDSGAQAQGNVWNEDELLDPPGPIDMSTFGAAGGLVSTPNDLVRFDRALRDGTLLGRDAIDRMTTPDDDGYGFGWVVSRAFGQTLASFPGAIDGYSGAMLRFLGDDTTVIVLANTEVVPGNVVAQDVAVMVYGNEPRKRDEPLEIKIAPGTYQKYAGTWAISDASIAKYSRVIAPEGFDWLRSVHVEQEGERLYFDVPGHARTWMHPMGKNRFFFKDHTGTKVSFEIGADRRAEKLLVHLSDATFELTRVPASDPAE